jgi:pyruvate dehydrogenase E2 component (dihydrolipoamide acetyltransferase)
MPRLSDSMEEGTVLRWLKQPGDEVKVGDELVEIETDKATMTYASDASGTLLELVAAEGETLRVGAAIARVGAPTELAAVALVGARERIKASPIARRLAGEAGIDLSAIVGTGPGSRIVKRDVDAARAAAAPEVRDSQPAPALPTETVFNGDNRGSADRVELTRLQQTVARRMAESKASIPHFYIQTEIDMTAAVRARTKLGQLAPPGDLVPAFNDMIVKACGMALREFPRVNGAYRDDHVELYSRTNVGIAVAGVELLAVPTIFDADRKSLKQIGEAARRAAARVRDGTVTAAELDSATFSVSNLGMHGISSFQAIINPPQAAILAVGEIVERPVVRDGSIAIAHVMTATLSCDHRIVYGTDGAAILGRIRMLLEEPALLAL